MTRLMILCVVLTTFSGCTSHWTGYDLYVNAGLQQNEGEMATKATSVYSLGGKIHFDRDR